MEYKTKSYDEAMLERWESSVSLYEFHVAKALDDLFAARDRLTNARTEVRNLTLKILKDKENAT